AAEGRNLCPAGVAGRGTACARSKGATRSRPIPTRDRVSGRSGSGSRRRRLSWPIFAPLMTQAMLRPLPERASAPALDDAPPAIGGQFFSVRDHQLYLRGVSHGPFPASGHGL